MALFKIFRGAESGLNAVPCHDGYAYFTQDSGKLFIDVGDNTGDRVQVNAYASEALMKTASDGSIEYIEVDDLLLKDAIATVAQGGTGASTLTVNAILIGNGTNPIKMVSISQGSIVVGNSSSGVSGLSGTGVLYAATAGSPQFGVAPISVGGTNANTAAGARTNLDVYSKGEIDNALGTVETNATTIAYTTTLLTTGWVASGSSYTYTYSNTQIKCGKNGNVPPIITYTSNKEEYSKITEAQAEAGVGITFTISEKPTGNIGIIITDVA